MTDSQPSFYIPVILLNKLADCLGKHDIVSDSAIVYQPQITVNSGGGATW